MKCLLTRRGIEWEATVSESNLHHCINSQNLFASQKKNKIEQHQGFPQNREIVHALHD